MKIPHTLLFLLTIFGSIFVSSVANPRKFYCKCIVWLRIFKVCNGTLLLTSFSGSSNGNYQAFDKTTSPALLTKSKICNFIPNLFHDLVANEESLTFSFWWQYFQPTDANTFTLFRLDQSAGYGFLSWESVNESLSKLFYRGTKSNDHWRILMSRFKSNWKCPSWTAKWVARKEAHNSLIYWYLRTNKNKISHIYELNKFRNSIILFREGSRK